MAEILGAEIQAARFISDTPGGGVVSALDAAGAVVNMVAWSQATGDVTYTAPAGSNAGGGSRRHLFDRPIYVGDTPGTLYSSDAQVIVSRNVVGAAGTGNGHAFSDSSTVNRAGVIGYNSFDARIVITGANNYDHFAAFQAAPVIGTTGTTTNYYAFVAIGDVTAGVLTNRYGLYAGDMGGAGAITNNYGVYVAALAKGTASNYAIYTAGSTPSYFGGAVTVAGGVAVNTATDGVFVATGATTSRRYLYLSNTGNHILVGVEQSPGGATLGNSLAYEAIIRSGAGIGFSGDAAVVHWRIGSDGVLAAGTDGARDIGYAGGARPRDIFMERHGVFGGRVSADSINLNVAASAYGGGASLYRLATHGVVLYTATGTVADFLLTNGAGTTVLTIPTGTAEINVAGSVVANMGGTISLGARANTLRLQRNDASSMSFVTEANGWADLYGLSFYSSGNRVLTGRQGGWGAPTGTLTRSTFATGSVTLVQLAERVAALISDLTTHGMIGA